MKTRKQIYILILSALMILSMMPFNVFADAQTNSSTDSGANTEGTVAEQQKSDEDKSSDDFDVEEKNTEKAEEAEADTDKSKEPASAEEVEEKENTEKTSDKDNSTETGKEQVTETEKVDTEKPSDTDKSSEEAKEHTSEEVKEESDSETEKAEEEENKTEEGPVPFTGKAGGVEVNVEAPKSAFPEGTKMEVSKVEDVDVIKAINDTLEGDVKTVKAVDITFINADGVEIQPKEPIKVTLKSKAVAEAESPVVVHVDENEKGKLVGEKIKNVTVDTNAEEVSFDAEHFSVYAVVDESTGPKARMRLEFYNGSTKIATMYVKNDDKSDELEYIIYDPGAGSLDDEEIFTGWILDNEDYTSADVANAWTIEQVREWAVSHVITEGEVHRLDASICKLYKITYKDDNDANTPIGMASVPVKASEYGTDSVPYTVNMAYTPKDDVHNFEGWIVDDASVSHITTEVPADHIYQNGTEISIKGDVDFTVNAPQGNWLIFDENGKGGTYNAPQFVKADSTTTRPRPDSEMIRNGYTFGGWYDSKEHADAHAANPSVTTGRFEFGHELDTKTTLYASWIPNARAPYTVIFWTQNQDRTAYEVAGSYVGNGTVGNSIPYTFVNNGDEDYVTGVGNGNGHYTGFSLIPSDVGQQVTITPEGDAVLNLHYDRITYNFKFYLYRSGNSWNNYDYANNSGNGSSLNDLVTWHSNRNAHPGVTPNSGYTIQSETVGGRTYYYFTMQAYYGEDISSKWPTYDKITGADGREAVSYVMMVGTKLKPRPTNQGSGTVKGLITVLDENILGATNNSNGNYVIVRFPDNYYNWRYHVWFETVEGEDYTGKTLHIHNGKTYYEETVLTVRSSNTTDANQNEPKYQGFDYVTRIGQNNSGTIWQGGHWTTTQGGTTYYHLNYIYNRQAFEISYFDGNYIDGSGNTIQNRATQLLHESQKINHGALIPESDRNYVPEPPEEGYVFDGWYLDEGCTTPYTWTTMPIGGIKVYAKWRQVEYRVFLHPNAGTDPNLDWGSETVSTSFRVAYGEKISTPTGKREGSGYEFVGWYTDPSCSSQYLYNPDTVLNNETVTTPYDQTDNTELDKWGNVKSGQEGVNKDSNENRFWITKKLDLYAKWRKVLEGADGINVIYTADDGKDHIGTNPPTDPTLYPDQSEATAQAAATAPEGMEFKHWVVQKWDETQNKYVDTETTVLPGQKFIVDEALAHKVPDTEHPGEYIYKIQLRAEYASPESDIPTHIWWFENYSTTGAERHNSFHQNEGIQINEMVGVPNPPERAGYDFLGWARVKTATSQSETGTPPTGKVLENLDEDDLYLVYDNGSYKLNDSSSLDDGKVVKGVAADERLEYHDMYAVWKKKPSLTVSKTVTGDYADLNKAFDFTFVLKEASGSDISANFSYNIYHMNGEEKVIDSSGKIKSGQTFSLKHNQKIEILGLHNGSRATITETVDANYDVYIDGALGNTKTVTITDDQTINFRNDMKQIVITGIDGRSSAIIVVVLAAAAGIGLFMLKRAKHRRVR